MQYLPEFAGLMTVFLLALVSPGPDFALVSRNSLLGNRCLGTFSAFGVAAAILVHLSYCLTGIVYLLSQSEILFQTIKYLGAGYLVYLGIKAFLPPPKKTSHSGKPVLLSLPENNWVAFRQGFWTNVLNPKATITFLSLFTQFIDPTTPKSVLAIYSVVMVVSVAAWFSFVAWILGAERIRRSITKLQGKVEKIMGAALVGVGLRVALSTLD